MVHAEAEAEGTYYPPSPAIVYYTCQILATHKVSVKLHNQVRSLLLVALVGVYHKLKDQWSVYTSVATIYCRNYRKYMDSSSPKIQLARVAMPKL